MSLDPFAPFVSVAPVITGCQQSGYLASRMSVSTTGWSDNHGPSRGEPWEPVGEQPGSFSGERAGACWRIVGELFASVSSAKTSRPETVSTEGGQNIPSQRNLAKSAVNLRLLARAAAARASAPTFHFHLGKGNKGGGPWPTLPAQDETPLLKSRDCASSSNYPNHYSDNNCTLPGFAESPPQPPGKRVKAGRNGTVLVFACKQPC